MSRTVRVCGPVGLLLGAALIACEYGPEPTQERTRAVAEEEPEAALEHTVAVTIDDLPWVGPLAPGEDRREGTAEILSALRGSAVPATGFVNCARAASGAPVLRMWLEAGMELGNHTAEHLDLNSADPKTWVADARECDVFLRDLTGAASVPFRYPYLHRGPTPERYRAARAALEAMEGPIAPVTINTGDWALDDPYVAALRAGDEERAAEIRQAFVEHVLRAAEHYREVAEERVGRDVPHVLLLHANALTADALDALLARLRTEGYRFVSLETALQHPVYGLEDDYIGPEGLSWLYRFRPAVPERQAWDREEVAGLRERFGS